MGCGGGGQQTTVQSNAPPQQYLDAYSQVYGAAKDAASTPLNLYPGATVADFTDTQRQAFDHIRGMQGQNNPYLTGAANMVNTATQPLRGQIPTVSRGLVDSLAPSALNLNQQSTQNFGSVPVLDNGTMSGLVPRGLDLTERSLGNFADVPQYSADAVQGYMNPYLDNVVRQTQDAFTRQNEVDDQRLIGNAISKGAWGGDRAEVARAALAGEQRAAQDPIIAGLYSSGFGQAQNQFNTQQAAAQQRAAQQSALEQAAANTGFGLYSGQQGLGLQRAAGQTSAEQQAAAQRLGLLSGQQATELGAAQGSGWLGLQGASALSGLGQQDFAANQALAGVGSLEQQQAQQLLNVPYQQWQALQSYPFQSIGWLSNIAQGLGSSSGNTTTSTQPGPNALSQVAGLGAGAVGLAGATGGFGSNGWLSGLFGGGGGSGAVDAGTWDFNRGGRVDGFAAGGSVPGFALGGMTDDVPYGMAPVPTGVPDLSVSIIPAGGPTGGTSALKRNYGTTQTSSGGGGGIGGILGPALTVAKIATLFNRGGAVPGFAGGGGLDFSALGSPSGVERTPIAGTPYYGLTPKMTVAGAPSGMGLMDYARSVAAPIFSVPKPPVVSANVTTVDPTEEQNQRFVDPRGGDGGEGGGMRAGGAVQGFALGGEADEDEDAPFDIPGTEGLPADDDAPFDVASNEVASQPTGLAPRSSIDAGKAEPGGFSMPWMSLAQAGFATAAGRSPNALTNLGQGAQAGLNAYRQERRDDAMYGDRRLRAKVYEDAQKERSRASQSKEAVSAVKLQLAIREAQRRAEAQTQHLALAAERNAISRGNAGRPTEGTILDRAVSEMMKTEGVSYADAYRKVRGIEGREANASRREDRLASESEARTERAAAEDRRKAEAQTRLIANVGEVNARAIMSAAAAMKRDDFTGKLTWDQAVAQARSALTQAGGTPSAPRATSTGAPKVGEERQGYRFKGGNPADRNSWEKVSP